MKNAIRLGSILFIVCAIAGMILAFVNGATESVIAQQELEESLKLIKEIFGDENEYTELESSVVNSLKEEFPKILNVYEVKNSGSIVGYAIKNKENGYKPDVTLITGINSSGEVVGVKVVSHAETNGIGTNALTPEYLERFNGEKVGDGVAVDVVSGATRTSNAIIAGVDTAKNIYLSLNK